MNHLAFPIASTRLLLHRPPMLLLGSLDESGPDHACGTARLRPDHPLMNPQGLLDPLALVEVLAQLAAASRGYESLREDAPPHIGYLTGVSDFMMHAPAHAGDTLQVSSRPRLTLAEAWVIEGTISHQGRMLAEGTLKLWEDRETAPVQNISEPSTAPDRAKGAAQSMLDSLSRFDLASDRKSVAGEFCFGPEFTGFQGHFPDFAILPGVMLMKMAVLLTELATEKELRVAAIERAKFTRPVYPGQFVQAKVTLESAEEKTILLKATMMSEQAPTASFVLKAAPLARS